MTLTAIETRYNGYRFRSRLEARWAVFLDAVGARYEYEPEGMNLGGQHYLPDFRLSHTGMWLEVKGQTPTPQERNLARLLAVASGVAVLIGVGLPGGEVPSYICGPAFLPNGAAREWAFFACSSCRGFGSVYVKTDGVRRCPICGESVSARGLFLDAAIEQAKGARFEHGEQPRVRRLVVPPRLPPGMTKVEVLDVMSKAGTR